MNDPKDGKPLNPADYAVMMVTPRILYKAAALSGMTGYLMWDTIKKNPERFKELADIADKMADAMMETEKPPS